MTRLTPGAEDLVQAGREALRPSNTDRERVFRALMPKLGGAIGAATTTPSTAPSAATSAAGLPIAKVAAIVVGVAIAGGGLFVALRPDPPPARPTATAPAPSAAVPPEPVAKVPESVASTGPAPSAEKPAPSAARPSDSLAEEVAILSRASAELHAGRPAAALKALDEHLRRFPRGVLTQERTSARVQALCALGRMKQAQAEIARLARAAPNSPHVARARKACGSGLTEKE